MMAWLLKLIGGWLPIGTKPFPEWLGKVLWAIGIYIACTTVMGFLFPQKNVINVSAGGIVQQGEQRDLMGIGCNFFRLYVKGGVKSK
jgi:hypothetical protein